VEPRPARADDLDVVVALWAELARVHHGRDPRFPEPSGETLARYRAWIAPSVDDPQRVFLVVEGDGGLRGFLHAEIRTTALSLGARPSGYITDVMVAPGHRRQGLGRRLVEVAMDRFTERSLERVGLAVAEGNPAALAFWQALGFTPYTRTLLTEL